MEQAPSGSNRNLPAGQDQPPAPPLSPAPFQTPRYRLVQMLGAGAEGTLRGPRTRVEKAVFSRVDLSCGGGAKRRRQSHVGTAPTLRSEETHLPEVLHLACGQGLDIFLVCSTQTGHFGRHWRCRSTAAIISCATGYEANSLVPYGPSLTCSSDRRMCS
jgi:hypothetical protein